MQPINENDIATAIVGTALSIHRQLGPGMFENNYQTILAFELRNQGLEVAHQVSIPISWNGLVIENAYKADLIVEHKVIIEIKSVERLAPVHEKQLLTYLHLADMRLGILLNFGERYLKDGIRRLANGHLSPPTRPTFTPESQSQL